MADELQFHILRGRRIEEFTQAELVALHEQLGNELPETVDELQQEHLPRLAELELIETELERRRHE